MRDQAQKRKAAYRFGLWGEWQAELLLRLKGYRVLARRLKTPVGEIDLVAIKFGTVVFVEVKARREREAAVDAIGARQRSRIQRAATAFLSQNPKFQDNDMRFDVVLVSPRAWPTHMKDAWRP